MMMLK
jgi:hypothetical protein